MDEMIQFMIRNGHAVLFAGVFAEQIGLPLPSTPLLLGAGALIAHGKLNIVFSIGLAAVASLLADTLWYYFGRVKGISLLSFLCKISLDRNSCVRKAKDFHVRYGAGSLLVAKFIPGVNTAAPPLAGIFTMNLLRFLFFDALGTFVWVGFFIGLGLLFSKQLDQVVSYIAVFSKNLTLIAIGSLAAYILWKYVQRRRFLYQMRNVNIEPEELREKLEAGDDALIVDVRHSMDFKAEPYGIPGALPIPLEELGNSQHREILQDHEVILCCA
jgi:membrane protein DedA with SNARE-associated domain